MKGIFFSAALCFFTITGFAQQGESDQAGTPVKTTTNATVLNVSVAAASPVILKGRQLVLDLQSLPNDKYTILLHNAEGKKFPVKTLNVEDATLTGTFDLPAQVKAGVYILQVISKSTRMSLKLVVD